MLCKVRNVSHAAQKLNRWAGQVVMLQHIAVAGRMEQRYMEPTERIEKTRHTNQEILRQHEKTSRKHMDQNSLSHV